MRLSTQKKIDLKENVANAINLTSTQSSLNKYKRNKRKSVILSLATDHQKPANRKKNASLRKPPEIGRKANTSIAKAVHAKHPEYIGLRKWPTK